MFILTHMQRKEMVGPDQYMLSGSVWYMTTPISTPRMTVLMHSSPMWVHSSPILLARTRHEQVEEGVAGHVGHVDDHLVHSR